MRTVVQLYAVLTCAYISCQLHAAQSFWNALYPSANQEFPLSLVRWIQSKTVHSIYLLRLPFLLSVHRQGDWLVPTAGLTVPVNRKQDKWCIIR